MNLPFVIYQFSFSDHLSFTNEKSLYSGILENVNCESLNTATEGAV